MSEKIYFDLIVLQVKIPTECENLSAFSPVQIVGGEQSLFIVTAEGAVFATGFGAAGRLGIGGFSSVSSPVRVDGLDHVVIRKVSFASYMVKAVVIVRKSLTRGFLKNKIAPYIEKVAVIVR